jgi:Arc/MetJ-type ribon-helix-helix transcriptional regulator
MATICPVARVQVLVQLTEELVAGLDRVRAHDGRSRSEVIREAIELHLAGHREAELDRRIIDGYRRMPPEDIWGDGAEAAARMIAAEPW